jgi:hypothetical protein
VITGPAERRRPVRVPRPGSANAQPCPEEASRFAAADDSFHDPRPAPRKAAMRRSLRAGAVVLAGVLALVLAACSPAPAATATTTTVTVRLWDDQVAQAYAESFAEFSRQNPDVTVALDLVPYADYFATLPDTLAAGTADDVFWLNSSYFGEAGGTATIEAPTGPRFGAGAKAFQPVLSEVFAGRTPVGTGLQAAQDAADAAIR